MLQGPGDFEARRAELRDWQRFLGAESHILREFPEIFFQQAANQPETTIPSRSAQRHLAAARSTRPWLRWVNKPRSGDPCVMTLAGHTGSVRCCAFTAGGDLILSASEDRTLRLWNAQNGREIQVFRGHQERIFACAVSADGRRVASSSWDGTVRLWDADTGREIRTLGDHKFWACACGFSPDGSRVVFSAGSGTAGVAASGKGEKLADLAGHRGHVVACVFSPDGSAIATASDDAFKVWDARTYGLLATHRHKDIVRTLVFSTDGRWLVAGSNDKTLSVWNTRTGRKLSVLEGHTEEILACAVSPDDRRVLSASRDATLKLWDAGTGKEIATLSGHRKPVWGCSFSGDGRLIASASEDRTLMLWDGHTGAALGTLAGHTDVLTACAFLPAGDLLLSASSDGTLKIWDPDLVRNGALREEGHSEDVKTCFFLPGGRRIVSAARGKTFRILDAETGRTLVVRDRSDPGAEDFAVSPDGVLAVSIGPDKTLQLWDFESGGMIRSLGPHAGRLETGLFSPDGGLLAASPGRTVEVWETRTGAKVLVLGEPSRDVKDCGFSPDGRLVFGVSNGEVTLWDVGSGKLAAVLEGFGWPGTGSSRAFSPDGRRFAMADGATGLKLWHLGRGGPLLDLAGHISRVRACSFSPDGRWLVSAAGTHRSVPVAIGAPTHLYVDNTLKLWDAETGGLTATMSGHTGSVLDCSFSPDGRFILSTSVEDATIRVWDARNAAAICVINAGPSTAAVFSPDGSRLAAGRKAGSVLLLGLENAASKPGQRGL
jgi:WD40 repeat protein